jgi:hypothetical protein
MEVLYAEERRIVGHPLLPLCLRDQLLVLMLNTLCSLWLKVKVQLPGM